MEGAGADCLAAWQNQLLELLQEPPSRGEAAAYQRRATLSSICVLSRSDPVARASVVPQLLDHVASSSANVEELDAGLRLMLRVLAVPAWGECSLCHTPRLLRSRPVGSLICGHPATLHMQRKCRDSPADQANEWDVLVPKSLVAHAADSGIVAKHQSLYATLAAISGLGMPEARDMQALHDSRHKLAEAGGETAHKRAQQQHNDPAHQHKAARIDSSGAGPSGRLNLPQAQPSMGTALATLQGLDGAGRSAAAARHGSVVAVGQQQQEQQQQGFMAMQPGTAAGVGGGLSMLSTPQPQQVLLVSDAFGQQQLMAVTPSGQLQPLAQTQLQQSMPMMLQQQQQQQQFLQDQLPHGQQVLLQQAGAGGQHFVTLQQHAGQQQQQQQQQQMLLQQGQLPPGMILQRMGQIARLDQQPQQQLRQKLHQQLQQQSQQHVIAVQGGQPGSETQYVMLDPSTGAASICGMISDPSMMAGGMPPDAAAAGGGVGAQGSRGDAAAAAVGVRASTHAAASELGGSDGNAVLATQGNAETFVTASGQQLMYSVAPSGFLSTPVLDLSGPPGGSSQQAQPSQAPAAAGGRRSSAIASPEGTITHMTLPSGEVVPVKCLQSEATLPPRLGRAGGGGVQGAALEAGVVPSFDGTPGLQLVGRIATGGQQGTLQLDAQTDAQQQQAGERQQAGAVGPGPSGRQHGFDGTAAHAAAVTGAEVQPAQHLQLQPQAPELQLQQQQQQQQQMVQMVLTHNGQLIPFEAYTQSVSQGVMTINANGQAMQVISMAPAGGMTGQQGLQQQWRQQLQFAQQQQGGGMHLVSGMGGGYGPGANISAGSSPAPSLAQADGVAAARAQQQRQQQQQQQQQQGKVELPGQPGQYGAVQATDAMGMAGLQVMGGTQALGGVGVLEGAGMTAAGVGGLSGLVGGQGLLLQQGGRLVQAGGLGGSGAVGGEGSVMLVQGPGGEVYAVQGQSMMQTMQLDQLEPQGVAAGPQGQQVMVGYVGGQRLLLEPVGHMSSLPAGAPAQPGIGQMMTTAAALTSNSRDVTGLAGAAASAAHRDSVGSGSGQTGEDGLRPGQRGGGRESLSLLLGSGSQAMLQGTSFGTGGLGSGLKLGPSGGAAMLGDAGPGRLQAFKALAGAAAAAAAVDLPHAALAAARPLHATPVALPEVASLGSPNAIIRSSVGFPAAPSSLLRDALEGRSRGTSEGGTRAGSGSSGAGRGAASTSVVSGGVSAVLGPAAGAGASGSGLLMLGPVGQVGVVETMPDEVWLRMVPPRYAQQPEWVAQVQARLRNMPNAPRTQATVPWTARVVSRERSLELFSLCADVGVSVIDLLPRVLFIAHFKLRKDVPINNSVGQPIFMWLSTDTRSHQAMALQRLATNKVGAIADLDDRHELAMSPQVQGSNVLLMGVILRKDPVRGQQQQGSVGAGGGVAEAPGGRAAGALAAAPLRLAGGIGLGAGAGAAASALLSAAVTRGANADPSASRHHGAAPRSHAAAATGQDDGDARYGDANGRYSALNLIADAAEALEEAGRLAEAAAGDADNAGSGGGCVHMHSPTAIAAAVAAAAAAAAAAAMKDDNAERGSDDGREAPQLAPAAVGKAEAEAGAEAEACKGSGDARGDAGRKSPPPPQKPPSPGPAAAAPTAERAADEGKGVTAAATTAAHSQPVHSVPAHGMSYTVPSSSRDQETAGDKAAPAQQETEAAAVKMTAAAPSGPGSGGGTLETTAAAAPVRAAAAVKGKGASSTAAEVVEIDDD